MDEKLPNRAHISYKFEEVKYDVLKVMKPWF